MKIIAGGITSPKGFQSAGSHIGIKRKKKDLALVYTETLARVAGVFTTNVVKAAPVLWNKEIIFAENKVRGIVINSGNANACTGEQGMKHAEMMAETYANCLKVKKSEILVSSTGIIGTPLPIELIMDGIKKISPDLNSSEEAAKSAAEAIMTTDKFTKEIAVEIEIQGLSVKIAGMAKGSGMIHPNMATMLSFITTDINISRFLLDKALKESVADSYNMISVDGDTSTNDMVMILANGMAENVMIKEEDNDYLIFKNALNYVNFYLAQQIIRDGEGATKFLEVIINGARTKDCARKLGKSVVSSSLVKTAFFGEDANWGRILAAMGYAGVHFDPSKVNINFTSAAGSVILMENGKPIGFDEEKALEILKEKDIKIFIALQEGDAQATAWGCDLSYEYVKINGEYRT